MTAHPARTRARSCRGFGSLRAIFIWLSLASALSGCASSNACYEPGTPESALRTVYIVQRGWHTGLAVHLADWPNKEWELLREFAGVEHIEFGWGDARFYQAERNTLWLGVRAALWPTPSAIHVIGFDSTSPAHLQAYAVVPVRVSADGLRALTEGVEEEFEGERPIASGPQASWAPAPNRFYEAKRSFYFPRMCNWWIATRLREAGCPIRPWTIVTASSVLREARAFGDAAPERR